MVWLNTQWFHVEFYNTLQQAVAANSLKQTCGFFCSPELLTISCLLWRLLTSFCCEVCSHHLTQNFPCNSKQKFSRVLASFWKKTSQVGSFIRQGTHGFFPPSFLPFNIYILKNYWPVSPSSVLRPRRRGPVNGDECYFWRTTGCHFEDKCRYKHIPDQKGNDRKPWLP